MKWATHLQEGCLNLLSQKLRSALALLGILVGAASVVAMVLGGELATSEALKQFKTLGTDLLAVTLTDSSNATARSGVRGNLSLQQANHLIASDKNIVAVTPYIQLYAPMRFNNKELSGAILGVVENFSSIVHVDIDKGRFISDLDHYEFYCVVGNAIYQEMKRTTFLNPIGQQIQVGKTIFTVIGVAKPWAENSFVYANIDNALMVPILTAGMLNKYALINNIIIQLVPDANIESIKSAITDYLKQYVPNKQLFFRSAKEIVARMAKQSEILTVFLGLIGGVSLLVGGVGVMNIMLVSVVERRREIGVRLAVGATRSDIRALFLAEAVTLASVGGLLGVIVGIAIAYVIAFVWHWQFTVFLWPPLIGFGVSAATGIFFGYYPAYKASQLNPIDALRSD